jgi:hemerythrin
MTQMIWNPAWETGISLIDRQHQELLSQFEALLIAIHENRADEHVPELLAFLSGYVDSHFSTEEKHMKATDYPGLPEHKAVHDGMRSKVVELLAGHQKDPSIMTDQVVNFMTDWLVRHINDEDRRMARYLHHFSLDGSKLEQ